jgi:hypothetical protein
MHGGSVQNINRLTQGFYLMYLLFCLKYYMQSNFIMKLSGDNEGLGGLVGWVQTLVIPL